MAMVQFNLLPDVKLAYIKAERQKQIVMSVSIILSIAAVALFVLLALFTYGVQKKSINDLTTDITTDSKNLTSTKDLNKILTVQNQLSGLTALHDQKIVSSRLFDYMQDMTPSDVFIGKLDADYTATTLSVEGAAPKVSSINTFADSLKFTKFTMKNEDGTQTEPVYAFSEVVLSALKISEKEPPEYTITAKYKPELFTQKNEITLIVPKMVTTRSTTEKPGAVFNQGSN